MPSCRINLHAVIAGHRIFATEVADRFDKLLLIAARFQQQKLAIRFALFFEIAVDGQPSIFQNQDLFATLFDVAQQVRRQDDIGLAAVANLAHQLIMRCRAGGSRPLVGSSRKISFGP